MAEDQVDKQDQTSTDEIKKDEANQDQANELDQDTKLNKLLDAKLEKIEAKYKAQIAGLDKANDKLQKELTAKEREGLDEKSRAEADLQDLKTAAEKAETELNDLRKKRIIDSALYNAELPAELFENRIVGETEEEIKADVENVSKYINDHIKIGVEKGIKELLKGDHPGDQSTTVNGSAREKLIAQYNEAEKNGNGKLMLTIKEQIRKLPK